jgi:hypothetical protein
VWAWCIGLSLLFFGITEPNAEIDPKIQPHKETHIQATKPSLSNTLISIHQNPLPYSSSKTHKSPLNKPKSDTKSLLRPQLNHLTYKKPTTHSNLHQPPQAHPVKSRFDRWHPKSLPFVAMKPTIIAASLSWVGPVNK